MLVVDFMHEFELGVWKALFTHLIRILYAAAPHARQVAELDERSGDSILYKLNFHLYFFADTVKFRVSDRQYVVGLIMHLK
jgi:hypothetical protein